MSAAAASCGPLRNGYHDASMRASSTAQSSRTSHARNGAREGSCDTPSPEPARPADTFEAHMTSRPFLAAAAALLLATLDATARAARAVGSIPHARQAGHGDVRDRHRADGHLGQAGRRLLSSTSTASGWRRFKIPADKAQLRRLRSRLVDKSEDDMHTLLDELGRPARRHRARCSRRSSTSTTRWMDEAGDRGARHRAAARPTSTRSTRRRRRPTSMQLDGHASTIPAPFGMYIIPDPADPTRYVVGVTQSRPRHAEPRLLPQQGRQVRRLSRGVQDATSRRSSS